MLKVLFYKYHEQHYWAFHNCGSTELNILKHEQIFMKPKFCITSTALSNAPISAACLDVTKTSVVRSLSTSHLQTLHLPGYGW